MAKWNNQERQVEREVSLLFSIILPLYQAERTLCRCLDSLLPALEQQDEVLLLDDGSTDNTPMLCAAYEKAHANIRLFVQENRGVSAARNRGIAQARGHYLCFVDGDDTVDTAAFSAFLQQVRQGEPSPDIWFNDFDMMTPGGHVLRASRNIAAGAPQYGEQPMRAYLSEQGTYANVWRCAFRREFLAGQSLLFQEGLSCGEDLLFMTRAILSAETTGFIHRPYYHYLVEQGESLSHNRSLQRVTDFLSAFQSAYDLTDGSGVGTLLREKLLHELVLLLAQLPELSPADRKEGERAMAHCVPYLTRSPSGMYRMAAAALRCFGVGLVAGGLCFLKRLKRQVKGLPKQMEGA